MLNCTRALEKWAAAHPLVLQFEGNMSGGVNAARSDNATAAGLPYKTWLATAVAHTQRYRPHTLLRPASLSLLLPARSPTALGRGAAGQADLLWKTKDKAKYKLKYKARNKAQTQAWYQAKFTAKYKVKYKASFVKR